MSGIFKRIFGDHDQSDPAAIELAKEQAEQKAREKKLQDARLAMLRRRGTGGTPGVQPEPNQPDQTLG